MSLFDPLDDHKYKIYTISKSKTYNGVETGIYSISIICFLVLFSLCFVGKNDNSKQ